MLKPGPPRATFLKKGTTFILRYFSFFRKTESSNIMYFAFLLGPLQSWPGTNVKIHKIRVCSPCA